MKRLLLTLALLVSAACAIDEGSGLTSSPPGQHETVISPLVDGLSIRDRRNAIAMRSRVAREFQAPNEVVYRRYSKRGVVLEERVQRSGGWETRASTLPAELAARPLASFLFVSGAASSSVRTPTVWTRAQTDTSLNAANTLVSVDTSWNYASYQLLTKDAPIELPSASLTADVYYSDSTDVGNLTLSVGAAVVTSDAVGDEFVEETWTSWDWGQVLSDFDAAVDPYSLRMGPTVAESTDVMIHLASGAPIMASQWLASIMREKANCVSFRQVAKGALGLAIVGGLVAVGAAACPVCTLGYVAAVKGIAGKAMVTGIFGFISGRISYHSCENS